MGGGGGGGRFRGTKGGRQRKGTPGDNRKQNEQTKSVARKLHLSKKEQEQLHRLVKWQDFGYQEILEHAIEWFRK